MDSEVKKALAEQVIKHDEVQNSFECLICTVKLSGIANVKPHLISKQHRETGARYAIMKIKVSPKSILDLLPPSVKDAAEAEKISVMESKEILCHFCKSPSTGIVSLDNHLRSQSHREEVARYAIKNIKLSPKYILDLLPPSVKDAAVAQEISVMESKEIMCHFCKSPSSGVVSLDVHLKGQSHRKKKDSGINVAATEASTPSQALKVPFKNPDTQELVNEKIVSYSSANNITCVICDLKFNGEASLEEHLHSRKHREQGARSAINDIKKAPKSILNKLSASVIEAAVLDVVTVTKDKKLLCNVCQVTSTGVVSLGDHLMSADHRKKCPASKTINSQLTSNSTASKHAPMPDHPLHAIPEVAEAMAKNIVTETDNKLEPFCCEACDKKFNSPGTLLDHLKSNKHITKSKTYSDSRAVTSSHDSRVVTPSHDPPSEAPISAEVAMYLPMRYSVMSDIRGHVYVFNYTKDRRGAEHDSTNLDDTFSRMGYKVFVHKDLTGDETNETLSKIVRKSELNEIDSFFVFFLSHGIDEYTFLANDGEELDLRLLRRRFTDRKCPYLRGKPKIFLVNYCRGDQMQKNRIEFDSLEVPDDMVTIHAATEGIMAKRLPTSGTIFVSALCEVLKTHAKIVELRYIYHILEDKMKDMKGTKPMWEDYGFKPFFFNPA